MLALDYHISGGAGVAASYDLESGNESGQPSNKPTDGQPTTINSDPPCNHFTFLRMQNTFLAAACID